MGGSSQTYKKAGGKASRLLQICHEA